MAFLVQQPNNSEEIESFTYDNNMKRSIVYYITDVEKSFDHCFSIVNSLITRKEKKTHQNTASMIAHVTM